MGSAGVLIGQGFDAHRFAPAGSGRELWIAGLYWPASDSCSEADAAKYEGIEGDSDGDVAAHALIDALLAAARLGDIGSLFGVGADAHGAGMHGIDMLQEVVAHRGIQRVYAGIGRRWAIIGNRPKIGTRRAEAEAALSAAVGCPVSVTATTTDHMGFTGRGEGIAAIANALVEKI